MEIPVSTRIIAMPTEQATPTESPRLIALWGMAPSVISSTCRLSTWTAGSAATIK